MYSPIPAYYSPINFVFDAWRKLICRRTLLTPGNYLPKMRAIREPCTITLLATLEVENVVVCCPCHSELRRGFLIGKVSFNYTYPASVDIKYVHQDTQLYTDHIQQDSPQLPVSVENISHFLNIIYASAEIDVAMPLPLGWHT